MQLTFNKRTALFLLRSAREKRGRTGLRRRPTCLLDPDPAPRAHWSRKLLERVVASSGAAWDGSQPLDVAVSSPGKRPKSKFVSSTVYAGGLPDGAFLSLGGGVAISSPELLFVELANELTPAEHLLLGFEFTGWYVRDARNAVEGRALFGIPAVTSVRRIGAFLDAAWHVNGTASARRTLALLADNAWSPFEAIVATMMSLPWEEYGYGFGRCMLNKRLWTPDHLVGSSQRESRVPDILVGGTHVGVNYDGGEHMALNSIADAGIALGRDPGNRHKADELDWAIARVREKYVDDGRRNRELSADGYAVYPVFREDLYDFGGLDRTMMQVLEALKRYDGWDVAEQQRVLQLEVARKERQALLQSLMPGKDLVLTGNVTEAFVRLPRRSAKGPSQS